MYHTLWALTDLQANHTPCISREISWTSRQRRHSTKRALALSSMLLLSFAYRRFFTRIVIAFLLEEHFACARVILAHAEHADGVARAEIATKHFRVVSGRKGRPVRSWSRARTIHTNVMSNSRLIQKLLLRMGAKWHWPIIETFLFHSLIANVVADILFGTVWWCIQPLGGVSFFSLLHACSYSSLLI